MKITICWLGIHNYKVVKLFKYFDTSYGLRVPQTQRNYKCTKCGKIKQDNPFKNLVGHDWELSDFK